MTITPELLKTVRRGQREPVWWTNVVLGKRTNSKQEDILNALVDNRFVAVPSCHDSGKTWVAAVATCWSTSCFEGSISITTAPGDRQVKRGMWKEIRTLHAESKIPLGGTLLQQEWELAPNWYAIGFTAPPRDAGRFRGFHSPSRIFVVGDEAGDISEDIYTGIKGILTGETPRALWIGHPTSPTGEFASSISGERPNTKVIHISAWETPNLKKAGIGLAEIRSGEWEKLWEAYTPEPHEAGLLDPLWVWERWNEWGEDSWRWQALVLGQIPEDVDDQLIHRGWIDEATEDVEPIGEDIVAIDPAGLGDAETAMGHRRGGQLIDEWGWADADPRGKIMAKLAEIKPAQVRIDEIGIGYNLMLHIRDAGYNVIGINVGKKPEGHGKAITATLRERFVNQRAQHFWHLREEFEAGTIGGLAGREILRNQLAWLKYEHDSSGRIRMESKDKMRTERGLPSPDRADMLMLLYAAVPDREVAIAVPRGISRISPWSNLE